MITNNSAKTISVSIQSGNPNDIKMDHELYVRRQDTSYMTTSTPKITVERIEPVVGTITESKGNIIYNIFKPAVTKALA